MFATSSGSYGGESLLDPLSVYRDCVKAGIDASWWWGRANSFSMTLGMEPGTGGVLLLRSSLEKLQTLVSSGGPTKLTLVLGEDGEGIVELVDILPVSARRVLPSASQDGSAPYFVELADRRWLLMREAPGPGIGPVDAYPISRMNQPVYPARPPRTQVYPSGLAVEKPGDSEEVSDDGGMFVFDSMKSIAERRKIYSIRDAAKAGWELGDNNRLIGVDSTEAEGGAQGFDDVAPEDVFDQDASKAIPVDIPYEGHSWWVAFCSALEAGGMTVRYIPYKGLEQFNVVRRGLLPLESPTSGPGDLDASLPAVMDQWGYADTGEVATEETQRADEDFVLEDDEIFTFKRTCIPLKICVRFPLQEVSLRHESTSSLYCVIVRGTSAGVPASLSSWVVDNAGEFTDTIDDTHVAVTLDASDPDKVSNREALNKRAIDLAVRHWGWIRQRLQPRIVVAGAVRIATNELVSSVTWVNIGRNWSTVISSRHDSPAKFAGRFPTDRSLMSVVMLVEQMKEDVEDPENPGDPGENPGVKRGIGTFRDERWEAEDVTLAAEAVPHLAPFIVQSAIAANVGMNADQRNLLRGSLPESHPHIFSPTNGRWYPLSGRSIVFGKLKERLLPGQIDEPSSATMDLYINGNLIGPMVIYSMSPSIFGYPNDEVIAAWVENAWYAIRVGCG